MALLPKCPACLMVVFGALGLGHGVHELAFGLLQIVILTLLVGMLALRRRGGGPGPLLLGTAGGAGVVAGQLAGLSPAVWPGALLLGAAWLWNERRRPGAPACGCRVGRAG
ncbi:MAG TPA: hypothetical protein VF746_30285 [Longimicrobium sp.]